MPGGSCSLSGRKPCSMLGSWMQANPYPAFSWASMTPFPNPYPWHWGSFSPSTLSSVTTTSSGAGDAQVPQGLQNSRIQEVAGESESRGVGSQNLASHLGGARHRRWCGPPPSRRGPTVLNAPAPSPYCGKSCCIHHCQTPSLNKFECTEPWAAVSIISLSSLNISLTFFFFKFLFIQQFLLFIHPHSRQARYTERTEPRGCLRWGEARSLNSTGISGFPLGRSVPGTCHHWV
jgi:hypothetical protein